MRHGATQRDNLIPIGQWQLSEKGKEQANILAQQNFFDVDIIFSSSEEKAFQTAKPIANKLKKEINQIKELSELNRDDGGFMKPEEYEKNIHDCLTNLRKSISNWETAAHALERFSSKIEEIDKQYKNKKILVVGHGFTINLYFAKLLDLLNNVYERFNSNNYADWGVVQGKKVIKDIAN